MDDSKNKRKYSRRAFLETGASGGIGVLLGLAASTALPDEGTGKTPETVRLLTADGKLVEVEKRLIPPMCGKAPAASNKELQEWMEHNKP